MVYVNKAIIMHRQNTYG